MRFAPRVAAILIIAIAVGSTAISAQEPAAQSGEYCTLFSKVRENLTGKFGAKVDPLTRFSGIEVMCDHKAMVFRQVVQLTKRDVDQEWVSRRSAHWSKTYCDRHPAFADAIRDGWTISTVMSLADGSALRIDAVCHDAEA
jgi:hypothetical protein